MRIVKPFLAVILFCALAGTARGVDDNAYRATILVSNEQGEAPVVDPLLVNAWGIAATATSPWWVANNGTGSSTLYTGDGEKQALEVTVPGAPTGMVANASAHFEVAPGAPARFLWASEDGTISGWNPSADATHALVVFSDPGSVYKGLAIRGDRLFTTDFTDCEVEVLDGTFTPIETAGGFEDGSIPGGYCPFGIQAVGDAIFVTYALREGVDDVAGQGHGFVREFDTEGNLVAQVASHGQLDSPWGMALAPAAFGKFGGCLIVGNFGNGKLNAYCQNAGGFHHAGILREDQHEIVVDGLWGIGFGNGARSGRTDVLYFAAGPDDETNGYFGEIEFVGSR